MILCFPNADALRLVAASSILPDAVLMAPASVASLPDRRVLVRSSVKVSKAAATELSKLGVTGASGFPDDAVDVSCWPEALPLVRREIEVPAAQTAVIFECTDASVLGDLVAELLRLGNDRLGVRRVDGEGTNLLLRAVGPPYYTVLRATDRNDGDATIRAFTERSPRVWVELGWAHPLESRLKPGEGEWLWLAAGRAWQAISEAPFRDIYDVLQFELPASRDEIAIAPPGDPITVSLKLTANHGTEPAEFWVLRNDAIAVFQEFVQQADERRLTGLRFAVGESATGDTLVILRWLSQRGDPPILELPAACAYRSHPGLKSVYVPLGERLQPSLRRDVLRNLFLPDGDRLVWLHPTGGGGFRPEAIDEAAFRPLDAWIEYVVDANRETIRAWIEATRFDYEQFACVDDTPRPPKAPRDRKDKKSNEPSEPQATAVADPIEGVVMLSRPKDASEGIEVPSNGPSRRDGRRIELAKERDRLQKQLLDAGGEGTELWLSLARVNAKLGDGDEAALCWTHAFWSTSNPPSEWAAEWRSLDLPDISDRRSREESAVHWTRANPTAGDVRRTAVLALDLALDPTAWMAKERPALLKFLTLHEDRLPIRLAWLAHSALHRAGLADELAQARLYDRLLLRLLERGLNAEIDLPFFLRTDGVEDSERLRAVRERAHDLRAAIQNWIEVGSKPTYAKPGEQSHSSAQYVDLLFAYAFARLGESQAAGTLLDRARSDLDRLSRREPAGLAADFLGPAFRYRIDRALEGKGASGPLPAELREIKDGLLRQSQGRLNTPEGTAHYACSRFLEHSRVLEPVERENAFLPVMRSSLDGSLKELSKLHRERNADVIVRRIREICDESGFAWSATSRPFQPNHLGIYLECLLLVRRCPSAFAEPFLQRLPQAIAAPIDGATDLYRKRGQILERAMFLAGHFEWKHRLVELARTMVEAFRQSTDDQRFELLAEPCSVGVRTMRRFGLKEELDRLLDGLSGAIFGTASLAELKRSLAGKQKTWLQLLSSAAHLASGWLALGRIERATPLHDAIHGELCEVQAAPMVIDATKLAVAYISSLASLPIESAIGRLGDLFRSMPANKVTNNQTSSNRVYSRLHTMIAEEVVHLLASEEFALGQAGQHWLEEDERRVRRRLHADMKLALSPIA